MDQPKKMIPQVYIPTDEEDAQLTAAAEADDENPEWTAEDFARAKPVWAFPELVAVLQHHGKLGRPPLAEADKKHRVTLYLDPDVLAQLKQGGKGWQTRANAALRKVLGL